MKITAQCGTAPCMCILAPPEITFLNTNCLIVIFSAQRGKSTATTLKATKSYALTNKLTFIAQTLIQLNYDHLSSVTWLSKKAWIIRYSPRLHQLQIPAETVEKP